MHEQVQENVTTHLAVSKGVNPFGWIVSSMKVRKNTVVARSFQGRPEYFHPSVCQSESRMKGIIPRKHFPVMSNVALASGD